MFDVVLTSGFVAASFAYPDQAEEWLKRNYSGAGQVRKSITDEEMIADLRAKLAAANEELSAIDAAMDKVDLPTRQDDFALTRVGRLLSLQDWWKDYAECTQKAVERAAAAERERDAALAGAESARRHTTSIQRQYEATNELFSGLAKQLAKALAEAAALRDYLVAIQAFAQQRARINVYLQTVLETCDAALATPSTAGERWKTMERVCAIAYQINRSVDSAELWDALSDALGNLGEMVDLNALAALEKGE